MINWEEKRLRDEKIFFEQKMEILKDGFRQLEEERRKLEAEKELFLAEKAHYEHINLNPAGSEVAEVLFRNADNPLALRKRYRDLVKIFHPDNLFGDEELVQQINNEYMRRQKAE